MNNTAFIGLYNQFNDGSQETLIEMQLITQGILNEARELEQNGHQVLIIGDFNVDAYRSNRVDEQICSILTQENWILTDLLYTQKAAYTFNLKGTTKTSWIDHVLSRPNAQIQTINIVDTESNESDHRAVQVEITIQSSPISRHKAPIKKPKPNWSNITFRSEYHAHLTDSLQSMHPLMKELRNEANTGKLQLKLDEAINELHSLQRKAIEAAQTKTQAAKQISKHRKRKSWWNDDVDNAHTMRLHFYKIWAHSNFQDVAAQTNMKTWQRAFRRISRASQKNIEVGKLKRICSIFKNDRNAFWKALKKLTKTKTDVDINIKELHKTIETMANEKLIINNAKEHDAKLKVEQFQKDRNKKLSQHPSNFSISVSEIERIIRDLSSGKAVGFAAIPSEAFKHGLSPELAGIVALILEKMIQHNITPHFFNLGQIKPILKDPKGSNMDKNNIRPLTISDTLANIYEKVIMIELEKKWPNLDKQFGFKPRSSCDHAIFVLRETALLAKRKRKNTYACAIDASKAFDKLNRHILWSKMIGKIDDDILASLINYYNHSLAIVIKENEASNIFKTELGVKQGGPLSPRLFALYMEDLVAQIESSGHGIQISNSCEKVNIILYADDIVLVSHSLPELQSMLNITEIYGREHEIKFNPSKTCAIALGCKNPSRTLYMCDQPIRFEESIKYLGVKISSKLTPTAHIDARKQSALAAANSMRKIGLFSNIVSNSIKTLIYKTYVRPILYYGLAVQTVNKTETKNLQTFEATLVKRIVGVSKYCRTTPLMHALGMERVEDKLAAIKLDLFTRLATNSATSNTAHAIMIEHANSGTKSTNRYSLLKEIKDLIANQLIISPNAQTPQLDEQLIAQCKTAREMIRTQVKIISENTKTEEVRKVLHDATMPVAERISKLNSLLDPKEAG